MIFDLHMMNALSSGFAFYKANQSSFYSLFQGVGTATLSAWYQDFSGDDFPIVRSRNAQGTAQAPLVTVVPLSESTTQMILSDFGGREGGVAIDTYMIDESVEIVMFAKSPAMARVYHVVARACIAIARRALHAVDYHVIKYDGAEALTPEEELASEELGIYTKRLRASASYRVQIEIPRNIEYKDIATHENVLVLNEDQKDSEGNAGGVSPDN
jgi:hypothetical protein